VTAGKKADRLLGGALVIGVVLFIIGIIYGLSTTGPEDKDKDKDTKPKPTAVDPHGGGH
jgi:hypothetical protein